jgi:hypothetical protein
MKKLIVLSLLIFVIILAEDYLNPAHAQNPTIDLKPTFIRSTPGLYINGWPAFTVAYPKEWVELPPMPGDLYRAGGTRPDLPPGLHMPILNIGVLPNRLPLEDWAKALMPTWEQTSADLKVLYDKPSQLKDGTPAREVELEYIPKYEPALGTIGNSITRNTFILMTKRESTLMFASLTDDTGKVGEKLKRIAYSFTFMPGREEPVNLPPDIREFFVMYCADLVSGDVGTLMSHFSDKFFHWGTNKASIDQFFRNNPNSATRAGVVSCEATVTVFEPREDKAYVDGFWLTKPKGGTTALKAPINLRQIIKEHGQWKWYGNQK